MDWLAGQQDSIEAGLAARHLGPQANPSRQALFDLSSSWMEGRHCPLAARGYSRDGKKGKLQIEYGLLTDPAGRPVAVRVFPGNTGDPSAFTAIVDVVRKKFGLQEMVMVGDRGMITSARIAALNQLEDGTARPDPYGWITALRAPAIRKLMADDGPLQLSPVRRAGPGRDHLARLPRRAADRLPQPGPGRRAGPQARGPARRHREAARPPHRPRPGRQAHRRRADRDRGGQGDQQVQDRQALRRHHHRYHPDRARRQDQIDAEAALDGFYVLRTPVPAAELDAAGVVTAYKNLKYVERDFRHIKADDLDLRPVFHRLEERVRAHVLICMLACYLTWHLRRAWAPLTFTDEQPPGPGNPVTPARRSATAQAKASGQHDPAGQPYRSFRGLLEHLATLTRNQVRYAGTHATIPMLTEPTSAQREAFRLIGVPIPLMLK